MMADCRYCGVANDDDRKEWYICESCRSQEPWKVKVCFNNYCSKLYVCKYSAYNTTVASGCSIRINYEKVCIPDYRLFQPISGGKEENKRLKLQVALAEKAHGICIDELMEMEEENNKLTTALSSIIIQACTSEPPRDRLSGIYEIAIKALEEENDEKKS